LLNSPDSKRVAFLIPSMNYGGAELQLTAQLRLLLGMGYSPLLIVMGNQLELLKQVHLPPDKILVLGQPSHNHLNAIGIYQAFGSAFRVFLFLRKYKTSKLVAILPMAHWVGRWSVFFGRVFFFNIRLCTYHQSQQFKASPSDSFVKKVFHRVNSVLAWYADKASLFISQSALNDISQNQFVRRPIIIYNFVTEGIADEEVAKYYLRQRSIVYKKMFIIPGRIHPAKGQVFFLEAVKNILTPQRTADEGILIVLAGSGPDEEIVLKMIRDYGLIDYTLITGFIENKLLLSLIKLADLVIIPSMFEGLGNVAIEALMLRKQVLTSDAGGLTEIVKASRCGVTFPAGDASGLRTSLANYLDGKLRFDTQAGYKWYKSHFTPQIHIERFARFIEELNP